MSLKLNDKKIILAKFSEKIVDAQTIILAEYRGMKVSDFTQLRVQVRNQGLYLSVIKNSLARRAIQNTIFVNLTSALTGPLIYLVSNNVIMAAKLLVNFAKVNDKLIIKFASYDGKALDKTAIYALASIPNREILFSQLMHIMQIPIVNFIRCLVALAIKMHLK